MLMLHASFVHDALMLDTRFYVRVHGKGQDLGSERLSDNSECMDDGGERPIWVRTNQVRYSLIMLK